MSDSISVLTLGFRSPWGTLLCSAVSSPMGCEPSESLYQNKSFLTKVVCVRCSQSYVRGGIQEQSRSKQAFSSGQGLTGFVNREAAPGTVDGQEYVPLGVKSLEIILLWVTG